MDFTGLDEKLAQFSALLREGRTTETDRQILELRTALANQLEEEKKSKPPPKPMETNELLLAVLQEVSARLGHPPRLAALLVELAPKLVPPAEAEAA